MHYFSSLLHVANHKYNELSIATTKNLKKLVAVESHKDMRAFKRSYFILL